MSKLEELERRLASEPNSLGLRALVAGALHDAGRRDDSIELYRSVAIAYRDQGRIQQAIAACRSILAIDPEDRSGHQLLATLTSPLPTATPPPELIDGRGTYPADSAAEAQRGWIERRTPPRLPRAPSPGLGPEPDLDPISSFEVTPLPAPLPYHVAYPTATIPKISAADLPLSLSEELGAYPQIAGIANAARQISASLIAASHQTDDPDDDVSGELQTRRLPRITAEQLRKIAGPPPGIATDQLAVPEVLDERMDDRLADDDAEPTLTTELDYPVVVDDETTQPREMPLRTRPPSITPPTAAAGPLAGAFFAPVPPRNRAAVLQRFRRRIAANGTLVIRAGETGHGLVIVVRGLLELRAERADGTVVTLGAIAPGEYVGETSLLTRAPAIADVIAAVDSEIMELGEADFYEVTGAFPALWIELRSVAERRHREHDLRLQG